MELRHRLLIEWAMTMNRTDARGCGSWVRRPVLGLSPPTSPFLHCLNRKMTMNHAFVCDALRAPIGR